MKFCENRSGRDLCLYTCGYCLKANRPEAEAAAAATAAKGNANNAAAATVARTLERITPHEFDTLIGEGRRRHRRRLHLRNAGHLIDGHGGHLNFVKVPLRPPMYVVCWLRSGASISPEEDSLRL